jgi:hypothetical protein
MRHAFEIGLFSGAHSRVSAWRSQLRGVRPDLTELLQLAKSGLPSPPHKTIQSQPHFIAINNFFVN